MSGKRLNATITIGGSVAGSLRAAFGSASKSITQLGSEVTKLNARQKELNRTIDDQAKLGRNASALKVRYAQDELRMVDKQILSLKNKLAVERKINDAQKENLAKRAEIRGKMVTAAGMAMGAGLAASVPTKQAADFNYQLRLIGNTANMSDDAVRALGVSIMDASKATGQSATNMQAAIGFLVAAGLDVETAVASVTTIGRAATASGGDIEDLSKAAFTLIDTLGIKPGRELEAAIDTLAQAGKEGNVELKDMAKVLPVLGSGFQALKMNGKEAAATLAAALEIARKGAATSDEAANNLQNFVAKLMSPETLKKAQEKFGVDLYKIITGAQVKGQNPFEAAVMKIMEVTKGDQKKIGELFGDMQVQNFIRPMMQNWEKYQEIKTKALSAKGVTDQDFAKMMAEAKKQFDGASDSAQRLGITVGNTLLPSLGGLATNIARITDSITGFVSENPMASKAVVGLTTGLVGLRLAALGAAYAFTFVRGAMLVMGRTLLLNPIGAGVAAIAGGAYLIWKNWEPLTGFFKSMWADITGAFRMAIAEIMRGIEWVTQKYQTVRSAVSGLVGEGNQAGAAAMMDSMPGLPAPAARGGSYQDNSQTSINVTQRPGEDQQALAKRVAEELERNRKVRERAAMYDGAYAQ